MSEIADLMDHLATDEGENQTLLPGVKVFKYSFPHSRSPLIYNKGITIVGQGTKQIYLGGHVYEYNPDNYLVLVLPISAECKSFATPEEPMLFTYVDIPMDLLRQIVHAMGPAAWDVDKNRPQGLFSDKMTPELYASVLRLLTALRSPVECKLLGDGLVREIIFRVMCGENAGPLYALAAKSNDLSLVEEALQQIHDNYHQTMQVEKLARLVNMSSSSFHRAFKQATGSAPLQYIKKLRLSRAGSLLIEQGLRVSEAATTVGYDSPSQFSREFKRSFGMSPRAYITANSIGNHHPKGS